MPRKKVEAVAEVVEEVIPHTEDDLQVNPELREAGVQVDEVIGLPTNNSGIKSSFTVTNSEGGIIRTYTIEDQGENAEALAHQYAGKIGGSVI